MLCKKRKKNEVSIVKAKTKTVLISALAILDCAFGGLVISSSINSRQQESSPSIKASGNYVVAEKLFNLNDGISMIVEEKLTADKKEQEQEQPKTKVSTKQKAVTNKVSNSAKSKVETKVKEKKEVKKQEKIVYGGMTITQLSAKLNRSLKSDLSGKGYLIATYSLSKGVDPYVATAIMLHETGCEWGCSRLVKKCNNVGGQKGSGCGSYASFSSLDIGIKKFIDNLAKNYYAKGLNTPEKMNKKYAESKSWSSKVNSYINKIKNK